jgi:glycolate oxidase
MENLSDKKLVEMTKALEGIVSKEYISTNLFERIKATLDCLPYSLEKEQLCHVVVMPRSKDEISEIMKYANSVKMPVFIRGSGTHLAGAYRPHIPGIVIRTHRLNDFQLFEDYGFFECGPACIVGNIGEELEQKGFFLPIAPGSRRIATMGGIISNNTSGHLVDAAVGKFGDYVLGLEVILPNGEVIETGTKGLRRPAGTDLTKLFLGGDGLLGVITKIRMRLVPPVKSAYGMAIFDDLIPLARGVQRMYMDRRHPPYYMEFLDEPSANFGFSRQGLEQPGGAVNLFVCIASSQDEATYKVGEILKSFETIGAKKAFRIEDNSYWYKLWHTREVIGSNLMQREGTPQVKAAEVVSTLKDLVDCMEDCIHFSDGMPLLSQLEMLLLGHIGGLTLHPGFLIPRDWDDETKRKVIDELFQRETEINLKYGTCGGEWGQLGKRKDFFIKRYGKESYEVIKSIKNAMDPNNILNPGILEGYR